MNEFEFLKLYLCVKTMLGTSFDLIYDKSWYYLIYDSKCRYKFVDINDIKKFIKVYDDVIASQLLCKVLNFFLVHKDLKLYETDEGFSIGTNRKYTYAIRKFETLEDALNFVINGSEFSIDFIQECICPKCGNLYFKIDLAENAIIKDCYCGNKIIDIL